MAIGDSVTLGDETIGTVVNSGTSAADDLSIGIAMLDIQWAHAGLDDFRIGDTIRTVAPPLLANRSLFVDIQKHSYATRENDEFPPLLPEGIL